MTEISLDHLDRQLQRVLTELAELRQQVAALSGGKKNGATPDHERWCTIEHFMEMLGYKSRISYYNNIGKPGFPQRVYSGKKPYLVYDDCVAYLEKIEAARLPAASPAPPPATKKRHPGRPAKLHARA